MKQVLIIDESPTFGEYLTLKLSKNGLRTETAAGSAEGLAKIKDSPPDLLIVDYQLSHQGCIDLLKKKNANPETARIPVVVLARQIDQQNILELLPLNVKKIFSKPIKIDTFFDTLKAILEIPFSLDQTPGNIEVTVNDGVFFVEISRGLNEDKLELLPFKIRELAGIYQIGLPRLVLTLKDIKLDEGDKPKLKKLLDSLLAAANNQQKNICLLSSDSFFRKYVQAHPEYSKMGLVKELKYVMEQFVSVPGEAYGNSGDQKAAARAPADSGTLQLHFEKDDKSVSGRLFDGMKDALKNRRVAVVDDDFVVREFVKKIYENSGAKVFVYGDGQEFVDVLENETFDLVFLDLIMPRLDGFEVLRDLKLRNFTQPVVVLSSVTERDSIVRAFHMGVKSYLTKPLKPDVLFKKSMEILKGTF